MGKLCFVLSNLRATATPKVIDDRYDTVMLSDTFRPLPIYEEFWMETWARRPQPVCCFVGERNQAFCKLTCLDDWRI